MADKAFGSGPKTEKSGKMVSPITQTNGPNKVLPALANLPIPSIPDPTGVVPKGGSKK